MELKTHAFNGMSGEDKRGMIAGPLGEVKARESWRAAAGVFNPTRTKLLETFRLGRPMIKGIGHHLYNEDGTEYLDLLSQYGAVSLGHNHPALWEVLRTAEREQLASMVQPLIPVAAQQLAARLAEITPGDLQVCVFTNSGAEAVEAAIKLARARTGRPVILSTWNSFHGKTLGALSATGRPMYQKPFGAPVPHFDYVPYGDLNALEERLKLCHDEIAAFIVEPIQGEAGIIPAPPGYLASALALCRRYGVLSIVDEVQTGLGRTGSLFALSEEAGAPDILLLAKTLGGGLLPIGACITTPEAWDDQFGLLHSSTFANNNLACRVALKVIELLLRDDGKIIQHVAKEGRYMIAGLRRLQSRYPAVIKDVRGRGYMLGLEFQRFIGHEGSGLMAYCSLNDCLVALLSAYLLNVHRIVTAPMFNSSHVLRLQPPFSVGRAEIDQALAALDALCDALDRRDYYHLVHHIIGDRVETTCSPKSTRRRYPGGEPAPATQPLGNGKSAGRFAFLVHYTTEGDFVASDPSFEQLTPEEFERWRDWSKAMGPGFIYHLPGIQSAVGHVAEGWLIAIPMLPRDMLELGRRKVLTVLEHALHMAGDRGATILGLGGFTSIVSRGGEDLTGRGLAITSGNTLTTIMACAGVEDVARRVSLRLADTHTAIVGATGAIGRLASLLLAGRVGSLTLVGNPSNVDAIPRCRTIAGEIYRRLLSATGDGTAPEHRLGRELHAVILPLLQAPASTLPAEKVALARTLKALLEAGDAVDHQELGSVVDLAFRHAGQTPPILCSTDLKGSLLDADVVLAATNSGQALIQSDYLKPGAVVCDVAQPSNVSSEVVNERSDILVFDGGLVRLPEAVRLGPTRGLPAGIAWGCFSETVLLALEGETRSYSIGQDLSLQDVEHLARLAEKHGLQLAPPYCHGRALGDHEFAKLHLMHAS